MCFRDPPHGEKYVLSGPPPHGEKYVLSGPPYK